MASIDDVMNELGEIRKMLKKLLDQSEAGSASGSVASPPGTYLRVPARRLPDLAGQAGLAEDDEIICVPLRRARGGREESG